MHVAGVRFTTLFILTHIKRFFIVFRTNCWTDVVRCPLACRAGRLSLLLYSPAQDGKHIKCFPLRAELATNLTPAPSPGDPPCRHFLQPVLVARRFAARRPRSPWRGCLRFLLGLCLWLKENGRCVVHPPFLLRLVQVNKLSGQYLAVFDEHSGHGGASAASGVAGAARVED